MNPNYDTPFYVLRASIVENPNTGQDEEVFVRQPKKRWGSFQPLDKTKVYKDGTEVKYSDLLICDVIDVTDTDRVEIKGKQYYIKQAFNPGNLNHHLEIALEGISNAVQNENEIA